MAPSIASILARVPPRIGAFRLVAPLGEGGFAPVFLAVEEYGGHELRTVALKLFSFDHHVRSTGTTELAAKAARDRIVEEARALCRVEHPGIVRFFQLVEEGLVLGLAMEHVRGVPLSTTIDTAGRLDVDSTLAVGAQVASALAAVHAAGLVHRDVKPDNLIQTGGQYKLIDFGIAARYEGRAASPARRAPRPIEARQAETLVVAETTDLPDGDETAKPEQVAGTMGYIDPACLGFGEPPDASSDLYALGATLYECLSGRLPASSGGGADVTRLRMPVAMGTAAPPPIRSIAPDVPEEVARLVDALVAPSRANRPKRAEWVACELERLRRLTKLGAPRALPPGGPFRGLDAFAEGDRDILMGRAAELASALDVLRVRGVLALVGASGSGKTSLARAGVVPAILEGGLGAWPPRWRSVAFTPGVDARASLFRALAAVVPAQELDAAASQDASIATMLGRRVEEESVGLLVVLDALEELVTLSQPATRGPVLRLIEDLAASPRPGLRAVVTLRRDLLDPLLALEPLAQALTRGAQIVAPLSARSLAMSLEERLAAYGYALEDAAMRDALGAELAATAESMPLVEFALARLWMERDDARRILPHAALARIGGIAGALEQHAESTLVGLTSRHGPSIVETVRLVLIALTTPQGTRTRATPEEIARAAPDPRRDEVIAALERARLVVREDGRLTLAHEALLVQWSRLRQWTADARRDRELVADVERAAARWTSTRRTEHLLRGRMLEDARRIPPNAYSDDAAKLLAASRRFEIRARAGFVALVVAVLAGVALFVAIYVDTERRAEAEKQAARGLFLQIASARDIPEAERARAVAALVAEKHACEQALARCESAMDAGSSEATSSGDAGAQP